MLLNPKKNKYEHLDERSREIMLKTITFFENKGKENSKKTIMIVYGIRIFWIL